jgi:hypothetical protein
MADYGNHAVKKEMQMKTALTQKLWQKYENSN